MRRGNRREKDDAFLRLTLVQLAASVLVFLTLFLLIRREDGLHLRIRSEFEALMAQDWDIAGLFRGDAKPAFSGGRQEDGLRLPYPDGKTANGDDGNENPAVILTATNGSADENAAEHSENSRGAGGNAALLFSEDGKGADGNAAILTAARAVSPGTAADSLTETFYGDDAPVLPASGPVTSDYGERVHPITGEDSFHSGRDIAADEGDDVRAVYDGTVIETGVGELSGNYVKIDHGSGLVALYCHCSAVFVSEGDAVRKGDIIAAVGQTGAATGPHLHFEIRVNGELRDPAAVLDIAENVD